MPRKTWFSLLTLFVALVVVALDRASKLWVLNTIPLYGETQPLPALYPYLRFAHSANTGIAFGLFQGGSALFTLIAGGAVVAIALYALHAAEASWLLSVSLGMMLGGAAGNLWDRLVYGSVIDFISVRASDTLVWPTFNLADTAIVLGTGLLILYFLLEDRRTRRNQTAQTPHMG